MMRDRDWNYIEDRLYAEVEHVSQAQTRLSSLGETELAEQLNQAIMRFNDDLRQVRLSLYSRRNEEASRV